MTQVDAARHLGFGSSTVLKKVRGRLSLDGWLLLGKLVACPPLFTVPHMPEWCSCVLRCRVCMDQASPTP